MSYSQFITYHPRFSSVSNFRRSFRPTPKSGGYLTAFHEANQQTLPYRYKGGTVGNPLRNYRSKFVKIKKKKPYKKGKPDVRNPKTVVSTKKKNIVKKYTKMPYKRVYKKRTFKRRPRRNIIPRAIVPASRVAQVQTTEHLTFTGTTGAIDTKQINWNVITDPFVGSSANQPLYYDQIKTMYRTAIVLGAKITVQMHNNSSTVPIVCGLYVEPYDTSTSVTSYEYFRELPWTGRQRVLSSDVDVAYLSQKISAKKYFKQGVKTEEDFRADIENDGSPTKIGKARLFIQALDQSSTATALAVVTIQQIVKFLDPYTPARSTA